MENLIYARQKELIDLKEYESRTAIVIGLGGIGSWVALNCALLGYKLINLIDPDTIEETNLNRTPFKLSDIGRYKTDAVKDLILERRNDLIVTSENDYLTEEMIEDFSKQADVFDCTDNLRQRSMFKPNEFRNYIKMGYDGWSITLIDNDFKSGRWGSDSTYTTVPSISGPPQIIAALGVIAAIKSSETKKPITITKECLTLLDNGQLDSSKSI